MVKYVRTLQTLIIQAKGGRMNLQNFYELNKIMKERMNYIENGESEDGNVWFRVVDKLDRKIARLIKEEK